MIFETNRYLPGHGESILKILGRRTAANSAAYLLSHLKPGMHILDVGCGPGSITINFAALVPQGHVIGLDRAPEAFLKAQKTAEARQIKNIEFQVGDAYALNFPDNTFDIVHAHQVLQYLSDPVRALKEMRRVAKPGGIVAVREGDFEATIIYPDTPLLVNFLSEVYPRWTRFMGGEPAAGRRLHAWARKAGFERPHIKCTSSTWCASSPEEIRWMGKTFAKSAVSSAFAKNLEGERVETTEELKKISQGWKDWIKQEDAWLTTVHGEIICKVV